MSINYSKIHKFSIYLDHKSGCEQSRVTYHGCVAPFPYDIIGPAALSRYPNAEIIWAQEEPKNMGAYFYVKPRLMTGMVEIEKDGGPKVRPVTYVGRMPSAAPANGGMKQHLLDQRDILRKALGVDK